MEDRQGKLFPHVSELPGLNVVNFFSQSIPNVLLQFFTQVPNSDAALNEKEQLKCLSKCICNEISYCCFPGQASSFEGAKAANGKTNQQMSE